MQSGEGVLGMQTYDYKGYEIVVTSHSDVMSKSYWRATYEIRHIEENAKKLTGTIAGVYKTSDEVEAAAFDTAKHWIDQQ